MVDVDTSVCNISKQDNMLWKGKICTCLKMVDFPDSPAPDVQKWITLAIDKPKYPQILQEWGASCKI